MNGIKVIKVDTLPPMTMILSPDLYQMLTDTPEQAASTHQKMIDSAARLAELLRKANDDTKS